MTGNIDEPVGDSKSVQTPVRYEGLHVQYRIYSMVQYFDRKCVMSHKARGPTLGSSLVCPECVGCGKPTKVS